MSLYASYHLHFHTGEDDVQHLGQCSFGGGLIHQVFAGQINVVTGPNSLENGGLMDLHIWGGDDRQQSLN